MAKRKREAYKVVVKKLGHRREWGNADIDKKIIEIDPRAKGIKKLEVLIHECLHIAFPVIDEEAVKEAGSIMAQTLWNQNIRPVDADESLPLQTEIR